MTCKNCGKQITDRTKGVCPFCGEVASVAPEGNGFYDLVADKNGQIVSAASAGNGVSQETYDRLQSEHLELKDAAKKLFLRVKILLAVSAVLLVFAIVATVGWIVSNGNRKELEDAVAKSEDALDDFEDSRTPSEVSRSDESADTSSLDASSSDIGSDGSTDTSSAEEESFVTEICAEHDYQISITVAPSCAEEGVSTFTRSKCGDS